jgi:hypothetical protein
VCADAVAAWTASKRIVEDEEEEEDDDEAAAAAAALEGTASSGAGGTTHSAWRRQRGQSKKASASVSKAPVAPTNTLPAGRTNGDGAAADAEPAPPAAALAPASFASPFFDDDDEVDGTERVPVVAVVLAAADAFDFAPRVVV